MKNKLTDLNNHLFNAMERLNDDELTAEQLQQEIARSKAIAGIGSQIINGSKVMLEAIKLSERSTNSERVLKLIESPTKTD